MTAKFKSLAVAIVGAIILSPSVAQDRSECGSEATQLELNQCAWTAFSKADAEMNRLYKQQMSQTGPGEESGSIWPMQNVLCQANLTRQRNQILKDYVACRQDGVRSG